MPEDPVQKRDVGLDVFKGLLVCGMVTAHVVQLLAFAGRRLRFVSEFVNLITFSGFVFAFGVGVGLSARRPNWGRVFTRLVTLALAYLISAFAYRLLVEPGRRLSLGDVGRVLSLADVPPYSEFLASFVIFAAVSMFARGAFRGINPWWAAVASCVALAATAMPVGWVRWNPLGLLVGSTQFKSFPVLQYSPWMLAGAAYASGGKRLPAWAWAVAGACTLAFLAYSARHHALPERFPPSAQWVIGPALVLLALLRIAGQMGKLGFFNSAIARLGKGVLFQLLASNLAIFTLSHCYGRFLTSTLQVFIVSVAIIVCVEGVREVAHRP